MRTIQIDAKSNSGDTALEMAVFGVHQLKHGDIRCMIYHLLKTNKDS